MNLNSSISIRFIKSLSGISALDWNALCPADYPFVRYEFLSALEISESVCVEKGWQPQHLIVEENNQLIAAMPLYLKNHSYGEYVFDWAWADAYKRHGMNYYPKLICSIPFTPCTGTRLLLLDQNRQSALLVPIIDAIKKQIVLLNASSFHCLFLEESLSKQFVESSLMQRIGCQFHWFNQGYEHWNDFVERMNSRKRKNINKERRNVVAQNIHFLVQEGVDTCLSDWQLFYQFYSNTYVKRSGHKGYLTKAFFELLYKTFSRAALFVFAKHQDRTIAAALYFKDAKTIYGRYWGCLEEYDFLHFETCYYQGIEYAINNKLQRFDGGAQGEHKIQRGFEPIITYSNHWLVHEEFGRAIENVVTQEALEVRNYCKDAQAYLPFKVL
jgi:uncharacterized protein